MHSSYSILTFHQHFTAVASLEMGGRTAPGDTIEGPVTPE